jgi:hypothetical protein
MDFPTSFEPQPSDKAPGWFRWASVGCGLIVLVLIGILVMGLFRADSFVEWGLQRVTNRVMQSLPAGVPDQVRQELRRKLDCALRAASDGRVPPARIGELARACTDALADRQVDMVELERIDALAGKICREGGLEVVR